MKHHKLVTKTPQLKQAQTTNKQAVTDFKVELVDQAVEFVFAKTS